MVVCRGVTKRYEGAEDGTLALAGVDLTVAPGELVAIMGPSGCGKSTLLHLIGGLDTPTAGEVEVTGQRMDRLSEARRAVLRRRSVGYVFQFFNLVANLTVADNIELPMLLVGAAPAEARERRAALLERLGLGDQHRKVPSQLSGGQQQRVALARALANHPPLLLADEPTGNLDTASARDVLALLRDEHAGGQTIVLVTHDERVAAAADRVLAMEDGRIERELRPAAGDDLGRALAGLLTPAPPGG
ncbi:MAG: ABC transporter ATP-binding protein [Acidimicrobiales bacterium]|nr:ABC transporter ATP-binding protein [Acidimicrobiales bacterium]